MRTGQAVSVAALSVVAVVITDLVVGRTLLRMVWPTIVAPADGEITSAPVTVRWEGPRKLLATLTGSGLRVDLGLRESPFQLDSSEFPRPGQYGIELRSPSIGRLVSVGRRFMIRRPTARSAPPTPQAAAAEEHTDQAQEGLAALRVARDRALQENRRLLRERNTLERENQYLAGLAEVIREQRVEMQQQLDAIELERAELARERLAALQENEILHMRIESIPACTAWGYLSYPRPQTSPPIRLVVVSNRRGEVFVDRMDCTRSRRTDRTAASRCVCVGRVWPP